MQLYVYVDRWICIPCIWLRHAVAGDISIYIDLSSEIIMIAMYTVYTYMYVRIRIHMYVRIRTRIL